MDKVASELSTKKVSKSIHQTTSQKMTVMNQEEDQVLNC